MLYVNVKSSSPVLPYVEDEDELSITDKYEFLKTCPTIDLRKEKSKSEVFEYLKKLLSYYFQISPDFIKMDSDLIEDIEKQVWAKELEVPADEVTYGRLFTKVDDDGNHHGGMSDRGLLIAALFMFDLATLTGVHVVESEEKHTFVADEDEFKSYYNCNTVEELVDIFHLVSIKCNE